MHAHPTPEGLQWFDHVITTRAHAQDGELRGECCVSFWLCQLINIL